MPLYTLSVAQEDFLCKFNDLQLCLENHDKYLKISEGLAKEKINIILYSHNLIEECNENIIKAKKYIKNREFDKVLCIINENSKMVDTPIKLGELIFMH